MGMPELSGEARACLVVALSQLAHARLHRGMGSNGAADCYTEAAESTLRRACEMADVTLPVLATLAPTEHPAKVG